jgi:hypothetical protein
MQVDFSKVNQLEHFFKILRSLRVNYALFPMKYNSKLTKINSLLYLVKSWELSVAQVSNILVPASNKYQICMVSGLLETTSSYQHTCILSFIYVFSSTIYMPHKNAVLCDTPLKKLQVPVSSKFYIAHIQL